jgi:hypothetical protein
MKMIIALALGLGLAGCMDGTMPDGGIANYDALRQAHETCAANGGTLTLKDGGNSQWLQDYACKRK